MRAGDRLSIAVSEHFAGVFPGFSPGFSQASRDEAVTGRGFCVKEVGASLVLLLCFSCSQGIIIFHRLHRRLPFAHSPISPISVAAAARQTALLSSGRSEDLPLSLSQLDCFRPPPPPPPRPPPYLVPSLHCLLSDPLPTHPLLLSPRCCSPSAAPATTYASAHKRSRSTLPLGALALPQRSNNQQPLCEDSGCHRVCLDCHRYEFSSNSPLCLLPQLRPLMLIPPPVPIQAAPQRPWATSTALSGPMNAPSS